MKKLSSLLTLMQIMTVFCLAVACSSSNDSTENKPDQPTPPPADGTSFTIPASGGTITKENLTLQIPSGTFSGETKISVTKVNKGSALNDMEASDFYKITLPVSTKKPIQVSVKSENASEGCLLMARSKGRSTSMNEVQEFCTPLEQSTGSNNTFSGEIPLLEIGGGSEDITVGLMGISTSTSRAATQADYVKPHYYDFSVNLPYAKRTIKVSVDYQTSYYDEKSDLILKTRFIPQALVKLDSLGFRMDADRKNILVNLVRYLPWEKDKREGCWGQHINSHFYKHWDCVEINQEKLEKMGTQAEQDELAKTLIHELGHYYQSDYDVRRSQWAKASYSPGAYLALKEASSVWTEHYYGSPLSSMIKGSGREFLTNGLWNYPEGKEADHGYGMGVLFTYLAQQYGDSTIVSIFDDYKKGKDADECLTEYAKRNEFNINDIDWYNDFLRFTAEGRLIEGFDMGGIGGAHTWRILDNNAKTMKFDINRYGMSVHNLYVFKVDTENKVLTLSELEDGTYTEVYRADFHNSEDPKELSTVSNVKYLGRISKNKPLEIKDSLEYLIGKKRIFFVTLQDPTISHKITVPSSLEFQLSDPAPTLSLPQSPVEFSAEGGEKTVTVTSNCSDLSIVSHPSWCSARIEDNVLYLNATKNGEENERSGEVKVKATNSRGSIEAAIEVKQQKTMSHQGDYDGVIVEVNFYANNSVDGMLFPSAGGRVGKGTANIDVNGNGMASSSGSYQKEPYSVNDGYGNLFTYNETAQWEISATIKGHCVVSGHVQQTYVQNVLHQYGQDFSKSRTVTYTTIISFDFKDLNEIINKTYGKAGSTATGPSYWFPCDAYRFKGNTLQELNNHISNYEHVEIVETNGVETSRRNETLPTKVNSFYIILGLWKDDGEFVPAGR